MQEGVGPLTGRLEILIGKDSIWLICSSISGFCVAQGGSEAMERDACGTPCPILGLAMRQKHPF